MLIVTLAVAMVTCAPLTNQEKLVNLDEAGDKVNRAKRADEEIVFGNQQNKARVVAKKSDLSNLLAPVPLPGEVDQGSEVKVHKEMPVTDELAARAEAAAGSPSENNEKIKEAVEAALEAVAEDEAEKTGKAAAGQEPVDKTDSEKAIKQLIDDDIEENEQGAGEASEAAEANAPGDDADDEDDDLRELQLTAESSAVAAGGNDEGSIKPSSVADESENDEVEKFLQESQDETEQSLYRDRERSLANQMRNFLQSLNIGHQYQRHISPSFLFRYRRSLDSSKKTAPSKNNKRARRIKRDLLDDRYYGPYELPYNSDEYQDPTADTEDVVPLTDEEADYLYKQLVNYLADDYTPEQEEPEPEEGSLDSYLNGYGEDDNEPYVPYTTYNDDDVSYVPNVYEDRYQYGPVDFVGLAKRGMIDYYPPEEEEKRYFFPFNKEPETHWGAFVPEKRSYDEAIQRLQRLALALSDNPGPQSYLTSTNSFMPQHFHSQFVVEYSELSKVLLTIIANTILHQEITKL